MGKVLGLSRRGNMWQYRVRVPVDLQPILERKEITRSLRTSSRKDALSICKSISYEIEKLFQQAKSNINSKVDGDCFHMVSPTVVNSIVKTRGGVDSATQLATQLCYTNDQNPAFDMEAYVSQITKCKSRSNNPPQERSDYLIAAE